MKDCALLATLPNLNNETQVKKVFEEPMIVGVRFNTGSPSPLPIVETLHLLTSLAKQHNKKLWIDIKGRQLRVVKWADPRYDVIQISHKVDLVYPATIHFRNGESNEITHVKNGNEIFVRPLPKKAVGAGQSVNILAKEIKIDGYLTTTDKLYLSACAKLHIHNFMASFLESYEDFREILSIVPNADTIVAKIESMKGMQFVSGLPVGQVPLVSLMAARDDLYIECGQDYKMFAHLRAIIERDPGAICASRILTSLDRGGKVDFADYADLILMYQMGYRRFMLCDNICNYAFDQAIAAWKEFLNAGD